MTTTEYRAHPGVNFSTLKHILRSPADYQAALYSPHKETPALLFGTLAHSSILEGKAVIEIATSKPPGLNLATKEGKEWKAGQTLPIIDTEAVLALRGMHEAVEANPHARHVLSQCQDRETPILGSLRGVECKALLDAHGTDGVDWCIVDLKTTDDASPDAFARSVAKYHYDMQAAFYSQLLAQVHQIETRPYWLWLAVQKTAPYTCAVYSANEWIAGGDDKVETALDRLKECRESGQWPQPYGGITELPKPRYA